VGPCGGGAHVATWEWMVGPYARPGPTVGQTITHGCMCYQILFFQLFCDDNVVVL
jgi:hypothetical protein